LAHHLLEQMNVRPEWLREGLAAYETGRLSRADAGWVASRHLSNLIQAVQKDRLFTLVELAAFDRFSRPEVEIASAQSWDMTRYLAETYGPAKLSTLLDDLRQGRELEQAFSSTFGLSLAEFEVAWRESVVRGHALPEWVDLAQTFEPAEVEAHIAELSEPDYAGRQPGLLGEEAAARYIADQFAAFGLIPVGDGGTFFQRFPITYPLLLSAPRLLPLNLDGQPLDVLPYRADFLLALDGGSGGQVEGEVIWVREEDYGGVRLSGQVVLRRLTGTVREEIAQAIAHGAGGLILVGEQNRAWLGKELAVNASGAAAEKTIPVVEVTKTGLERLLAASGHTLADLNASPPAMPLALRVRLDAPVSLSEGLSSANVLGLLLGADPLLSQEVIIIGAHYDHVGDDPDDRVCLADGTCVDLPGLAYPGANDDASAVGVLLEIARLWRESGYRPARSVLFAAWGAQELDEAGSRFYLTQPVLPLTNTIAALQLEAVGGGGGFYLQAQGDPDREGVLRFTVDAAAGQVEGRLDLVRSSRNSDHESFRRAGIPAMLIYWEEANRENLPAPLADEIDPYRLGVTGRTVTLALMMLAR
jgi:hypothetical protein